MSAVQFQMDDNNHQVPTSTVSFISQHQQVRQLLAHAMSLVEQDEEGAIEFVRQASALASRSPGLGRKTEPTSRGGLAPWQAERVKRHIEKAYASRINIDDLAQITRLSTSYFSVAFRVSFGTSPHDYISRRRIEHAKHRMANSDAPLCEIAIDCGFADQSHLCRVFRRVTGYTPAAWRRIKQVA